MGYRDDFYRTANIIGYSGQIRSFPSVYFKSSSEYGHITQIHSYPQNVGRMKVESSVGYTIGNEPIDGVLKLVEKVNGNIFHESRSTLTRIVGHQDFALLAQAIWRYPAEKYISEFGQLTENTKTDVDIIEGSEDAMANFRDLLEGGVNLGHVHGFQIQDRSAPARQDRGQFLIKVEGSGPKDPLVFDCDIRSARNPDRIISRKTDAHGEATAQWMPVYLIDGEIRFRGFGAFGRVETQWQKIVLGKSMTLQFGRYSFICEPL
jgi:hypothetical protein